jgi:hypothetical protein
MTSAMRLFRLGGLIVMVIGAWYHVVVLIPLGLVVILLGRLRGILFPVMHYRRSNFFKIAELSIATLNYEMATLVAVNVTMLLTEGAY